jgi:hypothetical protein
MFKELEEYDLFAPVYNAVARAVEPGIEGELVDVSSLTVAFTAIVKRTDGKAILVLGTDAAAQSFLFDSYEQAVDAVKADTEKSPCISTGYWND